MFGKKKSHAPTKMPGGNIDPQKVEAQKSEEKRLQKLNSMYAIFRCFFERQCIFIGVEEVAILQAESTDAGFLQNGVFNFGGLIPMVKPRGFEDGQKDRRDEYMRNKLKDMYAMTKSGDTSLIHEAIQFIQGELEDLEEMMHEVDNPTPAPNAAGLTDVNGVPLDSPKKDDEVKQEAVAEEPLQEESKAA
ncbi:hypothetical protein KW797_00085 [Candidatus Parcubacteria bacterium]|nr:hypothetical protein [Candidatus Parcubacteria bacterium]